uniref:Uncharacterized protein n=1 Tax=Timema bartmani TaxID=61472 RepID=A0A7R9F616_9NEOP|nr:unnamed protein product [Timema bartmani]
MRRPQKALLDALSSSTVVWGLLLLMTASVTTGLPKSRVPNYLRICHTRDPKLNDCIKDSISRLIVAMKNGSSELSVAPIDPLEIPFLEMYQGSMNASLQLTLKNTRITGLTNTEILTVKCNVVDNKFELSSKIPYLDIQGQFIAEGNVLTFPLVSSGGFSVNMSDATAVWIIYFHDLAINGSEYMSIDKFDLDVIPSDIAYDFGRVLDEDNNLGEAMSKFLNENSHEIFKYMKPKIMDELGEIFNEIGNQVLKNYPKDMLLPY